MIDDPPLISDLSLAYRVREATSPHDAALLLLLHGVGSNERDLLSLEPVLDERFHVVSARAPMTFGPDGFGWFSVQLAPVHRHDREEAEASRIRLLAFIDELTDRYGVPHDRLYLMGFSQGAVMSLGIALSRPATVGGVVAMSGLILPESKAGLTQQPEHLGLPILVTHGVRDETVPVLHGREARAVLEQLPVALEYHEYDMGHEVSQESLGEIVAWLERRLSATGAH